VKTCPKCGEEKPKEEFYKDKRTKDGCHYCCKSCVREHHRKWASEHKGERKEYNRKWHIENRESVREKNREWQNNNRNKVRAANKKWAENNRERKKKQNQIWVSNNRDKTSGYSRKFYYSHKESERLRNKKWISENPEKCAIIRHRTYKKRYATIQGKLNILMSNSIWFALKKGKGFTQWSQILGYDVDELAERLQATMPHDATWQDFLDGKLHIDHIMPKSYFKFTSSKDKSFLDCWSLSNIQLLWEEDNLKKSNKLIAVGF
jgi:hypothetical protein